MSRSRSCALVYFFHANCASDYRIVSLALIGLIRMPMFRTGCLCSAPHGLSSGPTLSPLDPLQRMRTRPERMVSVNNALGVPQRKVLVLRPQQMKETSTLVCTVKFATTYCSSRCGRAHRIYVLRLQYTLVYKTYQHFSVLSCAAAQPLRVSSEVDHARCTGTSLQSLRRLRFLSLRYIIREQALATLETPAPTGDGLDTDGLAAAVTKQGSVVKQMKKVKESCLVVLKKHK